MLCPFIHATSLRWKNVKMQNWPRIRETFIAEWRMGTNWIGPPPRRNPFVNELTPLCSCNVGGARRVCGGGGGNRIPIPFRFAAKCQSLLNRRRILQSDSIWANLCGRADGKRGYKVKKSAAAVNILVKSDSKVHQHQTVDWRNKMELCCVVVAPLQISGIGVIASYFDIVKPREIRQPLSSDPGQTSC